MRCSADGSPPCVVINKVASVEPETGSTYVVREADRGSAIRFRVTADVNADLTPDGLDNHLPKAVEIDTAPTAPITDKPLPPAPTPVPAPPVGGGSGGGGGSGPGGTGGPGTGTPVDATAPTVQSLRITKTNIVPGKTSTFKLSVSEPGTLRMVITKAATGRSNAGICGPLTKKNRTKKRCSYQRTITTITTPAGTGEVTVPFDGRIGKKRLALGTYTATIVVVDAAGNASKATAIRFRIVRR